MQSERRELATADAKGRWKPGQRLVKLPGETKHTVRSESAAAIARRVEIDKREKRIRKMEAKIGQ